MNSNFINKFKRRMQTVEAILSSDAISSEEGFQKFMEDYKAASASERANLIGKFFEPIQDAQAGMQSPFIMSEKVQKNLQALGTYPSTRVGDYASFANELTQDMMWMPAFIQATSNGAGSVDIVDFYSFVTVKELGEVEKIELSKLGEDHIAKMREKRFGTGVPMAQRWLETNGVYTLNTVVTAIREAFLTKQADFAYTLLASTSGVSTQTATAASVDAIITAVNAGAELLLAANDDKGFSLSGDTPLLFYMQFAHKGLFDQAMRRMQVSNSADEYTSLRFHHMVQPVYTRNTNFPTQFGGKNAGMLVLPGRKNVWVNFKPQQSLQENDFASASLTVMAQQYWNAQAPAAQRYIVNLEA